MQYSIDTLTEINQRYLREHWINQSDLEKINALSAHIEANRAVDDLLRGKPVPQDGDVVICVSLDGTVKTENAHLEGAPWLEENQLTVCVHPYTPFIHIGTGCSASGGPWFVPRVDELVYVGKRLKTFCTWGHMGGCADGAIDFQAEVNVWKTVDSKSHLV